MARVRFYYHEKWSHDETWYYLNKGPDGRAFVEREFSAGRGDMEVKGPERMEILDFLASGQGSAQYDLLQLIGTLVPDGPDA
jgi:hypothetical protein